MFFCRCPPNFVYEERAVNELVELEEMSNFVYRERIRNENTYVEFEEIQNIYSYFSVSPPVAVKHSLLGDALILAGKQRTTRIGWVRFLWASEVSTPEKLGQVSRSEQTKYSSVFPLSEKQL